MSNALLTAEIKQQLYDLKSFDLSKSANQLLQRSNKSQRQQSYKEALVELNHYVEDIVAHAITLRFDLHPGQTKKLHFKKDRIRLLKQHGIDYTTINGNNTAEVLSWISQSITHEDAIVTHELDRAFQFWIKGYPMVKLDHAYDVLVQDIKVYFDALIDALCAH